MNQHPQLRPVGAALFTTLVTAFAALAFAAPAQAQSAAPTDAGLYAGAGLGFNKLHTETITGVGASFGRQPGGNTKSDDGGVGLVALGWKFQNGLRVELEGDYRRNDFNHATAGALKNADATGKETTESVFVNALYDFPATSFGVTPYAGVGIGNGRSSWDQLYLRQGNEVVHFDDTVGSRAYQLILGASFLENLRPGLSFSLEYRYVGNEPATHAGRVEQSRFGAFPVTADLKSTRDQSLVLGLRYRFASLR